MLVIVVAGGHVDSSCVQWSSTKQGEGRPILERMIKRSGKLSFACSLSLVMLQEGGRKEGFYRRKAHVDKFGKGTGHLTPRLSAASFLSREVRRDGQRLFDLLCAGKRWGCASMVVRGREDAPPPFQPAHHSGREIKRRSRIKGCLDGSFSFWGFEETIFKNKLVFVLGRLFCLDDRLENKISTWFLFRWQKQVLLLLFPFNLEKVSQPRTMFSMENQRVAVSKSFSQTALKLSLWGITEFPPQKLILP